MAHVWLYNNGEQVGEPTSELPVIRAPALTFPLAKFRLIVKFD